MKTFIAALIFSTFSFCAIAQDATVAKPAKTAKTPKPVTAVPSYRCPQCNYKSDKAGDCPKDKISLVKVGDYYCPECYMSSSKASKCSMCGVDMKQMTASDKTK